MKKYKIVVIADPHQTLEGYRYAVQKLNSNENYKIVVLGDYVDHWNSKKWVLDKEHNPIDSIQRWIDLKKFFKNRVILLFGNHDMGYLSDSNISGHQFNKEIEIREIFLANLDLFDIAYKYGSAVFSHAGISDEFVQKVLHIRNKTKIHSEINKLFHAKQFKWFDFWQEDTSLYGSHIRQGPLWIRPGALLKSASFFNVQIVGHTEIKKERQRVFYNGHTTIIVADSPNHDIYLEFF